MNDIVAWATVVGGFATAIGVLVTLLAIWHNGHEARYSLNTELLLRLYEQFHSDQMRIERKNAASALLEIMKKGEATRYKLNSLEQMLNYFELLGVLLKRGAIDKKATKTMFSFWLRRYWQAAFSQLHPSKPPYIKAARDGTSKMLWQSAQDLVAEIAPRNAPFSEQEVRDFLIDEAQLNEKGDKS